MEQCENQKNISIESYHPSKGEVIVARYNNELSTDIIYKQHKCLREAFNNNLVISLPDNTSLSQMSIQELKNLLNSIIKVIKELQE